MSGIRIIVLTWSDILTWFSIWTLATYLTDVWGMSITNAAAVVNIWIGVTFALQAILFYLVEILMGHFSMLVLSSIAYCIGLGFLSMSTPPALSNATGTCRDYKPECIGHTQKVLFYTAMALIALGMSGHTTSIEPFLKRNDTLNFNRRSCAGGCVMFLVFITGAIALPYINPWSVRYGIPAIFTVVATLIFLSSSCSYNIRGPQGSALTDIFRVVVASASKITWKLPLDPKELYEKDDANLEKLAHTRGLRCLDKAAIKLPTNQQENANNRWKLCRVTEVEETKSIIRIIPMWLTFIICGLISSLGNTFFLQQANSMNPKVGKLKVPLQFLQLMYIAAKEELFAGIYATFLYCLTGLRLKRYAPVIGVTIAMIFSTLCCITAAKVETRRLSIVTNNDLLDDPEAKVPMSMFWLVPQYFLLAGLDSLMMSSVGDIFSTYVIPPSLSAYILHFSFGAVGVGSISSVLFVFIVGLISEKGGKSNWFQKTLNRSRLDKYYWVLAAISAVTLVLYILATFMCPYKAPEEDDKPPPTDQQVPGA